MGKGPGASKGLLQPYPRRDDGSFVAADVLFPPSKPLATDALSSAIRAAFERSLKTKLGGRTSPELPPEKLVKQCLAHLRERSAPILSPFFLSQCKVEDVFALDAISYEMQRHRMKIGTSTNTLSLSS